MNLPPYPVYVSMTYHEMIQTAYSKLPEPDTFKGFHIEIPIEVKISDKSQFIVSFHKGRTTNGQNFWCFGMIEEMKF